MERYNISGIYIFDKYPGEDKPKPTCFEDCSEEKQNEWLNSLDTDALKHLAKHLGKTIREIGDQCNIRGGQHEEN